MNDTTPAGNGRAPGPHRGALSALIVFYTMGLAGMAFLLGVKTDPTAQRLGLGNKSRPPARAQAQARPESRLTRRPAAEDRPVSRPRRQARVRRASARPTERRHRSASAVKLRAARPRIARRTAEARKPLRTARRPTERVHQMRFVILPRRSPDIAWVNPPPASWPKECRPPEPGSGGRF